MVHKQKDVQTPGEVTMEQYHYHNILFGGDQLTNGSQRICQYSEFERRRLEGLVPCVEDWHTKVISLEVS